MTDDQIIDLFGAVPYFADQTILPSQAETAKWPFRTMYTWSHRGSVNIMRICGTQHPDYAGLTWRELLSKGRRMDANLKAFRQNPSYYTELVERLPGMSLSIVDGKGYVTDDGNHRTCIGKFFLYGQVSPFMHGVHVSEQQTDLRMMALYERLVQKLPGYCKVTPEATEVQRDDGNGWATHFFEVRLRVENGRRRGYDGLFSADELEDGLLPELGSRWSARFGPYRNLLF